MIRRASLLALFTLAGAGCSRPVAMSPTPMPHPVGAGLPVVVHYDTRALNIRFSAGVKAEARALYAASRRDSVERMLCLYGTRRDSLVVIERAVEAYWIEAGPAFIQPDTTLRWGCPHLPGFAGTLHTHLPLPENGRMTMLVASPQDARSFWTVWEAVVMLVAVGTRPSDGALAVFWTLRDRWGFMYWSEQGGTP